MIVTVMGTDIVAVNVKDRKILWKVNYSAVNATGKTLWTQKWYSGGSVISADGMIYLFEEKSGHVALVKPDSSKLDIVSEFQRTKGEGPFWAHRFFRVVACF